ncbi:hypothetical protein RVM27_00350 [Halomonas sp. KM007]
MFIALFSVSIFSGKAQAIELNISSFEEMDRLVSAESSTREYLWCAVASSKIDMMDMHNLFMRKVARETENQTALLMAYTYMMGFFESEVLNIEPEVNEGEVIGMLYSNHCMKHILPSREGD